MCLFGSGLWSSSVLICLFLPVADHGSFLLLFLPVGCTTTETFRLRQLVAALQPRRQAAARVDVVFYKRFFKTAQCVPPRDWMTSTSTVFLGYVSSSKCLIFESQTPSHWH